MKLLLNSMETIAQEHISKTLLQHIPQYLRCDKTTLYDGEGKALGPLNYNPLKVRQYRKLALAKIRKYKRKLH